MRKAMKDYIFSDGTFIPKGTLVGVATRSLHYDKKFYENPNVFQPFRFAEMHKGDNDETKAQLVSTSTEYLDFGLGRHAWYDAFYPTFHLGVERCFHCSPGRFFAANELKTMLAHVVVTYDIKLEDSVARPRCSQFGVAILADPRAKVLFRKRIK